MNICFREICRQAYKYLQNLAAHMLRRISIVIYKYSNDITYVYCIIVVGRYVYRIYIDPSNNCLF